MLNRRIFLGTIATLAGAAALPPTLRAQDVDEKKVAAGMPAAKQLLLLMDTDKSGKVSRKEFMTFMEAEFDRLDVNKDGELDVKELTQMQYRSTSGTHR